MVGEEGDQVMTSVGPYDVFDAGRTKVWGCLSKKNSLSAPEPDSGHRRVGRREADSQPVLPQLQALELFHQRVRVAAGRTSGVDLAAQLDASDRILLEVQYAYRREGDNGG